MKTRRVFCYFIIVSFLLANSDLCLRKFFNSNSHIFSNQFFHIKAFLNDSLIDSIDIFIDNRKRIKIEYNEQIIYSNQDRILKFFPKTNQLYIDKPDSEKYYDSASPISIAFSKRLNSSLSSVVFSPS